MQRPTFEEIFQWLTKERKKVEEQEGQQPISTPSVGQPSQDSGVGNYYGDPQESDTFDLEQDPYNN